MPTSTIIILEESKHATHYSEEHASSNRLVHRDEFNKVIERIKTIIPKSSDEAKQLHKHDTITVLGSRGSGKTSFLLSIEHEIKKDSKNKDSVLSNIQVLDILDPTLIEEKGHVFLNVISRIMDLIDKKLNGDECKPYSDSATIGRKEWRASLNKLAAGLPSIDGVGGGVTDGWQDPEYVMDNGLRSIDASLNLAQNFNSFLSISLKILQKKAFLVLFDDIDVDASKGWRVLETIRKYFTGSQLITIVSGDMQLYSSVVRQSKWKNFGEEILRYEGQALKRMAKFDDMVTTLESQYLQKILQPRNRIHLPTLGEIKANSGYEDKIHVYQSAPDVEIDKIREAEKRHGKGKTDDVEIIQNEIIPVFKKILAFFGVNNEYQADAYITFLLGSPLRTQVQFLSLFQLSTGELIEKEGIASIVDIFISDLYAGEINSDAAVKSPRNLNRIILQFLLKEKKIEELYQLQPITTERTLNGSLLTLNFLLSYNIAKDPFLVFDYFIKVGYIRNLVPQLGYDDQPSNTTPSIEGLTNNTVILNDNVLRDVAGRIIAYVRGAIDKGDNKKDNNSELVSRAGTIPLYGVASKAKKGSTSDRIDSVLKDGGATYTERALAYMPLSSNQYVYKQSSLLTYSVYLLLGAIGELIRKNELENINNSFSELSQLRGYMMPDFKQGNNDTVDNDEDHPQDFKDKNGELTIANELKQWIGDYPENTSVSPHLLGKIATRFFFAQTNLESKVGSKMLGEVFHAHLIAFMNAVLIEDCRENTNFISELNLSNTNYNDKIFNDNIANVIENINVINTKTKPKAKKSNSERIPEMKDLSFSKWMLACPLLLVYLKNEASLKNNLSKYCDTDKYKVEAALKIDLRRFLDRIPIKSGEKRSDSEKIELFKKNYNQIKSILVNKKYNLESIKLSDYSNIVSTWSNYGIGRISRPNLRRFIDSLKS